MKVHFAIADESPRGRGGRPRTSFFRDRGVARARLRTSDYERYEPWQGPIGRS